MKITPTAARAYVERATLPPVPHRTAAKRGPGEPPAALVALKDSDAQTLVVGSGLVVAAKDVPADTRSDLVNCTLFAQLVATGGVADPADITTWYAKYFEALTVMGWAQNDRRFESFKSTGKTFEGHEAFLKVLTAFLGPGATALLLVKETFSALHDMQENSKWLTFFDRQSTVAESARFQVATAQHVGDLIEIALVAFHLVSEAKLTQVLFFKFKSNKTDLKFASGKATIYEAALAQNRAQIAARLAAYRSAYIGEVKLAPPPEPASAMRGAVRRPGGAKHAVPARGRGTRSG